MATQTYRFKIGIGDMSADGHRECEVFVVDSNKPVDEWRKAYKDSCKLTGLTFDHSMEYTGLEIDWGHPEYDDRHICTEFGDKSLSPIAQEILVSHGMNLDKYSIESIESKEDMGERLEIAGVEEFFHLLMDFMTLSLPEARYEVVTDELPLLNSGSLNHQFGYGIFDPY